MKVAVTAASGQLGKSIINNLKKFLNEEDIIALARTKSKAQDLGVEVRDGDYTNLDSLKESLQGIDTVLLVSGNTDPALRIEQHRNVIKAAKDCGVKKIVYTSVQGSEQGTAFSPIIQSNRQSEQDIINSGLEYVIGRNGIYIEPDIEYVDNYLKAGYISNCAGEGKCGYTTRDELGYAYAKMILEDKHNGNTYYLHGESLTQQQLADYLNQAFKSNLVYKPVSFEEYKQERTLELGDFLGTVIAGIYQGIYEGANDHESDYEKAAGRKHLSWNEYFSKL